MENRIKKIIHELEHHSPFTFSASLIAVILVFIILKTSNFVISSSLFEAAHLIHLFASAIVSAAIFYKYKSNFLQALLIGITGAILIGSLSDVFLPYLGGVIFNLKTKFHLPLIEEPILVLSIVIIGSLAGIKTKLTKLPHFIHVFLSVFAGLFYLLVFSTSLTILNYILIFVIVFITVLIPCCLSDIIFPFLFLENKIKQCKCD